MAIEHLEFNPLDWAESATPDEILELAREYYDEFRVFAWDRGACEHFLELKDFLVKGIPQPKHVSQLWGLLLGVCEIQ